MTRERGAFSLKKILLCAFFLYFCLGELVYAAAYDGELTKDTGTNWYFPGYRVAFEVSDPNIAEIITNKQGQPVVHFVRPGDVVVRAVFGDGDVKTYLFHITGKVIDDTSFDWSMFAMDVIRLTNEERKKAGLSHLKPAFDVSEPATVRADEVSRCYSHTRPDGSDFETVLMGVSYEMAGENLQAGAPTPEEAVREWMNSPTHRDNILFPDFTELAVGYVYLPNSKYHHYWVQIFLRR